MSSSLASLEAMRASAIFLLANKSDWLLLAVMSKSELVMRGMKAAWPAIRESRSWSCYLASFISLTIAEILAVSVGERS
jgi:hypothetical protein